MEPRSRPISLSRMSLLSAEVRMMSRLLPGVTLMLGRGVGRAGGPRADSSLWRGGLREG